MYRRPNQRPRDKHLTIRIDSRAYERLKMYNHLKPADIINCLLNVLDGDTVTTVYPYRFNQTAFLTGIRTVLEDMKTGIIKNLAEDEVLRKG